MTQTPLAVVLLAAGKGSRMKSDRPKVMHKIAGRPMIGWLLETVEQLSPEKVIVVAGKDMPDLEQAAAAHTIVIQDPPRGTGDAVRSAMTALEGFDGDVLVLLGDVPFITVGTLKDLRATAHKSDESGMAVLAMKRDDPAAYGRMVLNEDGTLEKIVEFKDASLDERSIKLCNTGLFCIDGRYIAGWLAQLSDDNAQGEFYLTDLPYIAGREGYKTHIHVTADNGEVQGVNSRADLAMMEAIVQDRLRAAAMAGGATLIDPSSVYFSYDTQIGRDVVIEPNVFFGPGVEIGDGVHIKAFSHFEGAAVKEKATVGPFARLRPGTEIGAGSKIGNFVEIKNSVLHEGVKAGHLAYIGDAEVGAGTNYSCGAITVNYDGKNKFKTKIGENVMVGSNVNLVAPVEIGDNAYIGAGSTITKDVPEDALAVSRTRERKIIEGWSKRKT